MTDRIDLASKADQGDMRLKRRGRGSVPVESLHPSPLSRLITRAAPTDRDA
jgi:hypothetical protein